MLYCLKISASSLCTCPKKQTKQTNLKSCHNCAGDGYGKAMENGVYTIIILVHNCAWHGYGKAMGNGVYTIITRASSKMGFTQSLPVSRPKPRLWTTMTDTKYTRHKSKYRLWESTSMENINWRSFWLKNNNKQTNKQLSAVSLTKFDVSAKEGCMIFVPSIV